MKRITSYFLLTIIIGGVLPCTGQVGIGTTSPNSTLDIRSTNQATPSNTEGILIPKIDSFPATNPTALQQGMLVYLTTSVGSNSPGFYYWNNPTTSWIPIGNSSSDSWKITGNTGTNSGTHFLGTTDNVNVVLRRNNIRAAFLGDPTYNLSTFDSNNGNTSFGANSLLNPTINVSSQTGVRNSAFGVNVMPTLTTGQRNTGVADFALFSNTSGSENTAIGAGAMFSNTISSGHVAIGRNALTSYNGPSTANIGNTAVGFSALRNTVVGSTNTALGYEALRNTTGSGNVGLGFQAGRLETGSNKLYIENSNADANNALVYGEFDTNILRINGTAQIGNPAVAGYALPTNRGTNGQLLQTDGAGGTSWTTLASNLSVVRVNLSANQSLSTSGWQKVTFNTEAFDIGNEFDTTTNRFTATKAGYYRITAALHTNNQSNNQFYSIGIRVNGNFYQQTSANHFGNGPVDRAATCIVNLSVGDYVEVFAENYQSGVDIDGFSGKTVFEIEQIR